MQDTSASCVQTLRKQEHWEVSGLNPAKLSMQLWATFCDRIHQYKIKQSIYKGSRFCIAVYCAVTMIGALTNRRTNLADLGALTRPLAAMTIPRPIK